MTEADSLLDSDVVIWHLRGHDRIARTVLELAAGGRLCLSMITRAEILQGMREGERKQTVDFLDACLALPVDTAIADQAGEWVSGFRRRGRSLQLADALIAATAIEHGLEFFTCNGRDYPYEGLRLNVLKTASEVNEPPSEYG